jgi:predicted nuclease of predicted toxin-antitoxin system
MIIWVDAQLPPTLAAWIVETFGITALSLKELGLRDAKDTEIFEAAIQPNVVIMSKDSDFVDLVCRLGSPPQILWLTCSTIGLWESMKAHLTGIVFLLMTQSHFSLLIVQIYRILANKRIFQNSSLSTIAQFYYQFHLNITPILRLVGLFGAQMVSL